MNAEYDFSKAKRGAVIPPTGNSSSTEGSVMDILLDVVKVSVCAGYVLKLEFENGERRVFDMSAYMDKKPFNRLKDSPAFFGAHVDYGTVVWPGNIDIAPETLYDCSVPVDSVPA